MRLSTSYARATSFFAYVNASITDTRPSLSASASAVVRPFTNGVAKMLSLRSIAVRVALTITRLGPDSTGTKSPPPLPAITNTMFCRENPLSQVAYSAAVASAPGKFTRDAGPSPLPCPFRNTNSTSPGLTRCDNARNAFATSSFVDLNLTCAGSSAGSSPKTIKLESATPHFERAASANAAVVALKVFAYCGSPASPVTISKCVCCASALGARALDSTSALASEQAPASARYPLRTSEGFRRITLTLSTDDMPILLPVARPEVGIRLACPKGPARLARSRPHR